MLRHGTLSSFLFIILEKGKSVTQRVGILIHKGDMMTGRVTER
ncbi:MAG: hypothetical protein OEY18_05650 [Candidatus Aminicenantes bacterium]|nr:hypothetical protein [Candidatus Aminicenantes bacterium]